MAVSRTAGPVTAVALAVGGLLAVALWPVPTSEPVAAPVQLDIDGSFPTSTLDFDPMTYDWERHTGPVTAEEDLTPLDGTTLREDTRLTAVVVGLGQRVTVDGATLTLEDVVIHGDVRALEHTATSHVVMDRCFADGPGKSVFGTSLEVRYCEITGDNDGLSVQSGPNGELFAGARPSVVEYNWIHRPGGQVGDNHHDGIQLWQGRDLTIRRNRIEGWQTSAILLKTDFAPIERVTISENYLSGAGFYTVYVRDGGFGRPRWVTITDNVFGGDATPVSSGSTPSDQAVFVRTEAERQAAFDAGDTEAATWIVWSGNVDESGAELPPPGGWRTAGLPGVRAIVLQRLRAMTLAG